MSHRLSAREALAIALLNEEWPRVLWSDQARGCKNEWRLKALEVMNRLAENGYVVCPAFTGKREARRNR